MKNQLSSALSPSRLLSLRLPVYSPVVAHGYKVGALLLLVAAVSLIPQYLTVEATFVPLLLLLPLALSAQFYGLPGGVIAGLIAGLFANGGLPTQTEASPGLWFAQLLAYIGAGALLGGLFRSLNRANQRLISAVITDPRTGLANQGALDRDLSLILQPTSRRKQKHRVALLMIELTDLSEIFQGMGTNAADELIAAVARRLRNDVSAATGVYRFSTAEVVLVLESTGTDCVDDAIRVITELGEEMWELKGVPVRVQFAVGSSLAETANHDPQELVRQARTALMTAVDRRQFYLPYRQADEHNTVERLVLISRLRKSLRTNELELFYQPKVSLLNQRVTGCEGLIRWRKPDGSYIPPGAFMPKVENTTLIAPVTRFVIQQACDFLKSCPEHPISINFSARNLFDKELLFDLPIILEQAHVDPAMLEIEITERALIQKPELAKAIIRELRGFGLKVTLDDFGTGYSSFSYLRHLPLSGLKIDRDFVTGIVEDDRARYLMRCLIEVAAALDMDVTVEGVETIEQARTLRDMNCDLVQGYYFSKPLAANDYRAWQSRALAPV